ncbi:enoyl-CoA hydratase/isomerase family protein [Blastococcus sp. URHD0036]|uniref:enoyl-CoA hydratase/isomerase family protein n=1 Tax=Blastococcus sp. URHD0036 TaxID=1380356 RepID=UPI000497A04D|nr:enoyl-CoA hydratase/isomerase family protein [Blastococcus sp. URHD0036]
MEVWVDGQIGHIQLAEPERLNPLGANEIHVHYALEELRANLDVRVVVLSAQGRAFCAGADIRPTNHFGGHDELDWSNGQRLAYKYAFGNMWETLHNFPKPMVAAVQGYCLGGGWELAHMCDLIIASDDAVFGAVEMDVGLPPFSNTCNYLAKMVGKHKALDWLLNARRIPAQELLQHDLVNQVVPRDQLFDTAVEVAKTIAARPPLTVAAVRQLVKKSMNTMEHYELERAWAYFLKGTDDSIKARAAVAERQPPPEFTGE